MHRNCDKFIFLLLDKLSVSNAHNVVADVFLGEVTGSFLVFMQVLILFGSEMTESTQDLYHLIL